ncbi:putative mitochondrial outer membrane protein [Xylariaceae sp. FL0594]|nr:putative mitochondrial outer membrane protein [Xylariaceae sp. FL0594]
MSSSGTTGGAKGKVSPPMSSGWFTIPAPLARLFKKFPLLTYPPNELPARSPDIRDIPTLYVFISDEDALKGLPSFNPSCLKWQTFLKLSGIDFRVRSSNNHASPTGALPFLLPPSPPPSGNHQPPIASNKLEQYAQDHGTIKKEADVNPRLDAYESLLDHRIRNAWLYTLYLSPSNTALLSRLYVEPATASRLVRATLLYQLKSAAESQIVRSTGRQAIDPGVLYREAREAFGALETLLGDEDEWFFGAETPGLFDAHVFSYTYLILNDGGLAWENKRLGDILRMFPRLVAHRERIFRRCWGFDD